MSKLLHNRWHHIFCLFGRRGVTADYLNAVTTFVFCERMICNVRNSFTKYRAVDRPRSFDTPAAAAV